MKAGCLSLFAVLGFTFSVAQANSRIVGGTTAHQGDYPYIVSLQANGFGHFCGGSLIGDRWVLTAAHCVDSGVDSVYVGLYDRNSSSSAEKFTVSKIYVHPKNNPSTTDYDFALIELSQNSSFKPIALNTAEISIKANNTILATTAGWGTTSSGSQTLPSILREVSVPLVSKADCNAKTSYDGAITDSMICAGYKNGGKDSCQGDSGGPLVVTRADGTTVLAGVVSWGEGCAAKDKYGVYGKVNAATAWIKATTGIK